MSTILTLDSARLRLRPWRDDDLPAFAALNADPQVMRYFPAPMTAEGSRAQAERIRAFMQQHGWGLWAVEVKGGAPFIGFVGLARPGDDLPCAPCVEIGWRLAAGGGPLGQRLRRRGGARRAGVRLRHAALAGSGVLHRRR